MKPSVARLTALSRLRAYGLAGVLLVSLSSISVPTIAGASDSHTPAPVASTPLPTSSQISDALELAAENALPPQYPGLDSIATIPAVLLKAVAWEESNWRQFTASGRPLVSGDGGYGVMQITDGMGGTAIKKSVQSRLAHDYLFNIASGARILSTKYRTTPRIGNGDPTVLEHWYYAVWAYNAWGWQNNPNNPRFNRRGTPVSNPAGFPYQERVFYLIAHPPLAADGQPLWQAVPVGLPDARLLTGHRVGPLPEPAAWHVDTLSTRPSLSIVRSDVARFLADLTVPDGTVFAPGAAIHKVWLLRNAGTVYWSGYTWRFVAGDRMQAPASVSVPDIAPSADVTMMVDMVAPARPGHYRGYWRLYSATGSPVGPVVWIDIRVSSRAETSPTPTVPATTPSATATATVNAAAIISQTLANSGTIGQPVATLAPGSSDNAEYVADLTIPDGTVMVPGQHFVKAWRIRNTGSRTWDRRYHWQFEAGAPMGPVRSVASPKVAPGATVAFSVPMIAPRRPGLYVGYWQMTAADGSVFGSQVTVVIRVRAQTAASATPTPTTAPSTSSTAPAPSGTPTAQPSATPAAVPTLAPTPAEQPWFGPPVQRAFFAEGYTGDSYRQYVTLLNPTSRLVHAQLAIFRADGATHIEALTLGPLSRRSIYLNALVPRASTALKVEADGHVVVERGLFTQGGQVVAGAPSPQRRWYMPESYVGSGYRDELRLFNPGYLAATITILAFRSDGSVVQSHRTVLGGERTRVSVDDVAPVGASGLEIDSSEPIVAESVVRGPRSAGPGGEMGLTTLSRSWYFPGGGTASGDQEYLVLLNPGDGVATVRLHVATLTGYQRALVLHVGAHARAVYVLHRLVHLAPFGVIADSDRPIAAQQVRYGHLGGLSLSNGVATPALGWALAEGHTGDGFSQWLSVLNPGSHLADVTVRLMPEHGPFQIVRMTVPAHTQSSLYLNPLIPTGPVSVIARSNHPIVIGRTMVFNAGKGLSTTAGVALS